MKIAITSKGADLTAMVDPRFGRALNIIIVDLDNNDINVINNRCNAEAAKGAGIQTASQLSAYDISFLLTGDCGPNARKVCEAADIKVIEGVTGTVEEVVSNFKGCKYDHSCS